MTWSESSPLVAAIGREQAELAIAAREQRLPPGLVSALERAIADARREGYLLAMAHAETAAYSGLEALYDWLNSRPS